ncbi:hypothetical protein GCM10027277_07330 [Pseudoduganella ginsengisoli]
MVFLGLSFCALSFTCQGASDCSSKALYEKGNSLLTRDQLLRSQHQLKGSESSFQQELRNQDRENQRVLDEIVSQCGWPDNDAFFNSLLEAAVLIVLHAPHNYQEKHYANMRKSYMDGKIPKNIYVLFENRFNYTKDSFAE